MMRSHLTATMRPVGHAGPGREPPLTVSPPDAGRESQAFLCEVLREVIGNLHGWRVKSRDGST